MKKSEARSYYRTARRALEPKALARHGDLIAQHLGSWIIDNVPSGMTVALHYGMDAYGEVPTVGLHEALSHPHRLAYPKVLGKGLAFHRAQKLSDLAPGFNRIPEPVLADAVGVDALAVVVVPGVAFTRDGSRLGQGGGHYDRLLSSLGFRAKAIGIAHTLQIANEIECFERDQRVHGVLTEDGWILKPEA